MLLHPVGFISSVLASFVISGTTGNSFGSNVSSIEFFECYAFIAACHILQVYGGAVSSMIGAYAWSLIGIGISSACILHTPFATAAVF